MDKAFINNRRKKDMDPIMTEIFWLIFIPAIFLAILFMVDTINNS